MRLPYGETWIRLRKPVVDRVGDRVAGADVALSIPQCAFEPASTDESNEHRETTVTTGTLYVPFDADVTHLDQMKSPQNRVFVVVDIERWPERHPMTGRRFGYKPVLLKAVGNA